MFNKIINFSVDNRVFIFIFAALLILLGFKSFNELSIDAVPDITNTQVQIHTQVKGLTPEEIERMITFPIEYSMNGIPGVSTVRSISRYGISSVTIIFNDGFDIYKARQLTAEKLRDLDLPGDVTPTMGPISTGLGEIFHYSIEAREVSEDPRERLLQLMQLRSLQDWFIKPRLLSVKGVTEVNTIGGHKKQFFIQPKLKEMTRFGIHFDDIEKAIRKTNLNVGGGYIQQTGEQLLIRGKGLLSGSRDIENVIVKRLTSYQVIRVKDIATVGFDKELRTGAATVDGKESIVGTSFMLLGENSRTVANRVAAKLEETKKNLPDWVKLRVLYDRSNMVNSTLETVEHNLLFGAGLVIIFLLLLVGNLRAAILTALMIPISLLITFILMKWQNVSGNLMSLGALDFGIVIDGAVIVTENCVRRLQQKAVSLGRDLERREIREIVKEATIEIRSAAGFGELIVITAFLPLFALTGIEGKMFGPMAMTFIMALVSALLLSFTLVPALAATFLKGSGQTKTPLLFKGIERLFYPFLTMALRFKKGVLFAGVSSIILGVILFSRMGSEFIPKLDEGDFAIQFIRPANISISNSVELQKLSEDVIRAFPQVSHVFGRTGTAEVATDPMGVNISDTYIMLKDKQLWPRDKGIQSKDQLMDQIKKSLEQSIPGQVLLLSQPVALRFNELLEGTKAELTAKVFGEDLDVLISLSRRVSKVIAEVPGAGEVESESRGKSPLILFEPKPKELADLGITARPVLDAISTAIGGKEVGEIFEGVKRYPIITRLPEADRQNIDFLKTLPVGITEGFTVPIEKLATISFGETFSSVSRENSQRRVAVLINPNTRDIESFVAQAQSKVSELVSLPTGYFIEWGGSFKSLVSAKKRLFILVPLALVLILTMLYTAFKNFAQVLLIFLCAPMSLIGGVLSLNLLGIPFSISAGVGFIALTGISILNGVVLVSCFNRYREDGISPDRLVEEGVKLRLRPVLMTALTDIFGFLPMMFSSGLGAEVQRPLAAVVVGGMISSTLLSLIVIPSLYALFYKHFETENIPV